MALKLNANVSHKVCSPSSCSRVSAVLYPPASQIDRFSPCSITSPTININHSTSGAVSTSWQPVNRASVVCAATPQQSVDPLAVSDGVFRFGKTFTIHDEAELKQYTTAEPNKHKLTVLMAKSSHCRPCKKFASTYHSYAARFHDSQLLEIIGDETKETRKMMVEMKVKVTPTFFLYRDGVLLESLTGTTRNALSRAIVRHLKDGEAGKDVQEEPVTALDSEDEDD